MADELYVDYEVVLTAATEQDRARTMTERIEQTRQGAGIEPGALGKILPAEEIETSFREATDATRENLEALMDVAEGLASRLRWTRELFELTDEAVADRFTSLLEGTS